MKMYISNDFVKYIGKKTKWSYSGFTCMVDSVVVFSLKN